MRAEIAEAARSVVNDTLTAVRAPLLSRRFQRAVGAMPSPVLVNIGAGNVRLGRWINTDVVLVVGYVSRPDQTLAGAAGQHRPHLR